MIPAEILRQVRRIQILTDRAVNDVFAGEYESVFKGRGMEFDEVRPYTPGDEIRTIDWNVTARAGEPYVKQFVEERELTVMLLVDLSGSGQFGSTAKLKNEIAAELCAVLSFVAMKNNDKVGAIIFTDRVEKFIPPKKGPRHALRIIREFLAFRPEPCETNMADALDYLGRVTTKRSVVFLVSDFLCGGYEKALRVMARRHDVIALRIVDPREIELPSLGFIELEDAETGETVLVDTWSSSLRRAYRRNAAEFTDRLDETLRSMAVDRIDIRTDESYVRPIELFFRMRERRR
jgi:uncharacterized protein (DUF58 family)